MRKKIPEVYYRSSRICRILGNPTAYHILRLLIRRPLNPSTIAKELGLSVPTISIALRNLRQIDLVRYENQVDGKVYSIKDDAILSILDQTELLVERIKTRDY